MVILQRARRLPLSPQVPFKISMSHLADHQTAAANFSGIFPALFTPFNAKNEIDFDVLNRMLRFQVENGVSGFFVAGTTGEGLLLSEDERVELVKHVAETCRNDDYLKAKGLKIVAHVGHPNSDTAAHLAKRSEKAGADWIASVGPIFYRNSFEGTVKHYTTISRATNLPFMIYAFLASIIPERDKTLFNIPNVAGMKYTGADFFSVQQLARHIDRPVALISGMDEQFVAAQTMGFQAGIGSTYNFAPGFYTRMLELCRNDRFHEAAKLQADINQVTYLLTLYENWSYRKAFMRYIGLDCGSCRPPFEPITDHQYAELEKKLDAIGILTKGS